MTDGDSEEHSSTIPASIPAVSSAPFVGLPSVMVDQPVAVQGVVSVLGGWILVGGWLLLVAGMISLVLLLNPFSEGPGSGAIWGVVLAIGCGILASLILGLLPSIQRRRMRERVRSIVAENPTKPLAELVAILQQRRCWLSGHSGTVELVQSLSGVGRRNEIVRLCCAEKTQPVKPLNVSFEPRLLDETDVGFRELADSTEEALPPSEFLASKELLPVRKSWRNTILKEGRLTLCLLLILWLLAVHGWISTGVITYELVFLTVIVAASLFLPATGGELDDKWHIVPGGVFVQLAAHPNRFQWCAASRHESVLAVHQLTGDKWIILISDEDKQLDTIATAEEVQMLLRAWMSPVPMPPEEQLAGLMQ